MPKKKLFIKSKLVANPSATEDSEGLRLIKKPSFYPKSYRWRKYDIEVIEDLLTQSREVSGTFKPNAINILRGALLLAQRQSPKKLLEIILEAERKSRLSDIE